MPNAEVSQDEYERLSDFCESILCGSDALQMFDMIRYAGDRQSQDGNTEVYQAGIYDEIGYGRSWVTSRLDTLVEYNIISKSKEGRQNVIDLSPTGVMFGEIYSKFVHSFVALDRLRPFFENVRSYGAVDFAQILPYLYNAEVYERERTGGIPREEYESFLANSDKVLEVAPERVDAIEPAFLAEVEDGLVVEVMLDDGLWNELKTRSSQWTYIEDLSRLGVTIQICDISLPSFTISVNEQEVLFIISEPFIVVKCQHDMVVEWTRDICDYYREKSTEANI